jgi:large subunit ribosomal protein L30
MSEQKPKTIRLRQVRSGIGCPQKHKLVLRGLGFRKLQQVIERPDTDAIRGMVAKVSHLVVIVE